MTWTRRRLGYLVWGVAFVVLIVPELLASIDAIEKHLPFPTSSRTVGHLEVVNSAWEILPTSLIVLFVYALLTTPVPRFGHRFATHPQRPTYDDELVPEEIHLFWWRATLCVAALVVVPIVAEEIWPDQHLAKAHCKLPNFYVAYCFWGLAFVLWVLLPTWTAIRNRRHTFPSLPNTIANLMRALGGGESRAGRAAAWSLGFVLVWGMAFLLLHLTLYPFPDITRQLNQGEIACGEGKAAKIVSRLPHERDPSCHRGGYRRPPR